MPTSQLRNTTLWRSFCYPCCQFYVLDLGVRYRRSGTLGRFVREHWFSILMVIPYLRVLRLFRLLRLLRLLRVLRIGRLLRIVGALR